MEKIATLTLKIWRQKNTDAEGGFETYKLQDLSVDMSFLEMLDYLNQELTKQNIDPVAFDHDCREGICGSCGAVINGQPHGPVVRTTLCQLYMRDFQDKHLLTIEPFRAKAFPVIKDLIIDRSVLDRLIAAGGYITTKTGEAPDANIISIDVEKSNTAFKAASCIGCGACVAACPNTSSMLFVGAKVTHLTLLPQGQVDREDRVIKMVKQMDQEDFGVCANTYECEAYCPKGISVSTIAFMNKEFSKTIFSKKES